MLTSVHDRSFAQRWREVMQFKSRESATLNRTLLVEDLEHRICLAGDACHFDSDSTAAYALAARSINCLAADMYQHVQAQQGNLLVSPTSIGTALGMVYAATAGASSDEMEAALYLGEGGHAHNSFAALVQSFARNIGFSPNGPEELFELEVANSMWPSFGVTVKEAFKETIERSYDGTSRSLDYSTPEATEIINSWVEEMTNGRIQDLFNEPLGPDTLMVLVNSIFFKAFWELPFDPRATSSGEFRRADGTTVSVPMMYSGGDAMVELYDDAGNWLGFESGPQPYYTQIDGFEILDRPLKGQRTSMVYMMPTDPNASNEITSELLGRVDAWMDSPRERTEVDVFLPKLESTVSTDLLSLLSGMMPLTFPNGDFSNMFEGGGVMVDKAVHKAFLEMNEQGTEAAAATAISFFVCFAAGTPVRTPDGPVVIEKLRPGDLVLSRDEHNENGTIRPKKVEEVFTGEEEILEIRIGNQTVRTTALHRFYVRDKGWTAAEEMQSGDLIASAVEEGWTPVAEVFKTGRIEPVYNFRVAEYHTYFIGDEAWGFDLWTHNVYGCYPVFRADRPFHFLIRENETSSILFMGRVDDPTQIENNLNPTVQANNEIGGDFNDDSKMDISDADALVAAILSESDNPVYDLTADGLVDGQDLDQWRALAGAANLPTGAAYPSGDTNLDGKVDAMDLNTLGVNWLQRETGLSGGDLNADGLVDVIDLNRVGSRWLDDVSGGEDRIRRTPRAPLAAAVLSAGEQATSTKGFLKRDVHFDIDIHRNRDSIWHRHEPRPKARLHRQPLNRRDTTDETFRAWQPIRSRTAIDAVFAGLNEAAG